MRVSTLGLLLCINLRLSMASLRSVNRNLVQLMIKPRKGKSLSTFNIEDSCFCVASLNIPFFNSDMTITESALLHDPHLKTKLLIHICEI